MEYLRKILSLFLCFLMGITGPVISTALADGAGKTIGGGNSGSSGGAGGCPLCPTDPPDETRASSTNRAFFYNGSEYLQETDLALPGIMPILIQRTYNNQSTFDSPMGYGWDFSFNDRLRTYADNSVVIRTTTGIKIHFVFTGGVYVCEESLHLTLNKNLDGSFVFYASPVGTRLHFDWEGKLVRQQDLNGNSIRMTYSAEVEPLIGTSPNSISPDTPMVVSNNYQLLRVAQWDSANAPTGRYVDFNYDTNTGRLTSIADFTGRTVSYQHDSSGNLTRIDYPGELLKTYQYTDPADPNNMTCNLRGYGINTPVVETTREYDTDDRLVREENAGGVLDIDYTIPLQQTTVTKTIVDSQGVTLHQVDTVYTFNAQGYLTQTTDEQISLELVRDRKNNVIKRIISINNGTVNSPDLEEKLSSDFLFDSDNNMTESSITLDTGEKIISRYQYDNGIIKERQFYSTATPDRVHKYSIDFNYINNLPTAIKDIKILTSNTPTPVFSFVSFEYNEKNQATGILFENGDKVTLTYNNGLLASKDGVFFNYDTLGNVISTEDRNGNHTYYEYDEQGRTTKVTNALGEETIFTYTGWYLTHIEQGKTPEHQGIQSDFIYDNYGRLLQSSTDLNGSPAFNEYYTYDSEGNILTFSNQQEVKSTFTYDPWGRVLSETGTNSNETTYNYSPLGQLLEITNALNQVTTYDYDQLGRVIKITDPMSGMTLLTYDETGKITKVIDTESKEFSYGFDLVGRTLWEDLPGSGRTSYSYDGKGRVSRVHLENSQENIYSYNQNNSIQEITLAAGSSEETILRYGRDSMGNLLWYSDSRVGVDPLLTMTYDALNRLSTKTLNPVNKTTKIEYTSQGQRRKFSVSEGTTELFSYSYGYDYAGNLTSLTEQPANTNISFFYDSNGFIINQTYANNTHATFDYASDGLLTGIHYKKSDDTTISQYQYIYDALGNINDITTNQETTSFSYDNFGHVTSADYPVSSGLTDESFTYDLTGNRLTSADIPTWTYNDDGQLIGFDNHTITYDSQGREITENDGVETVSYDYDGMSRLEQVSKPGTLAEYFYDNKNRRIKKTINGANTWYLYDGAKIVAEFQQTGDLVRNYSYNPGSFELLNITEGASSYTVLSNHLQTPEYVLDEAESVQWQAKYQVYGEALINNDVDNDGNSFLLSHRFPGQYQDSESQNYYNWSRSYNPKTGRYISPDSIGLRGGVNLYTYAQSNPVNFIDPNGQFALVLALGMGLVVVYSVGSEVSSTWDPEKSNYGETAANSLVTTTANVTGILYPPAAIPGAAIANAIKQKIKHPDRALDICDSGKAGILSFFGGKIGSLLGSGVSLFETVFGDLSSSWVGEKYSEAANSVRLWEAEAELAYWEESLEAYYYHYEQISPGQYGMVLKFEKPRKEYLRRYIAVLKRNPKGRSGTTVKRNKREKRGDVDPRTTNRTSWLEWLF